MTQTLRASDPPLSLNKSPPALAALCAAWLLLAAPTLTALVFKVWSTDAGRSGPILLCLGVFLLVWDWPRTTALARPGEPLISGLFVAAGAELYFLGVLASDPSLEAFALVWIALASLYAMAGAEIILELWLPFGLITLAALGPLAAPRALADPMQFWFTDKAIRILKIFDIPLVRDGFAVEVDQYRLMVGDALGGPTAPAALMGLSLVYLHLRRAGAAIPLLVMAPAALLLAFLGDFVRLVSLIGFTHLFGVLVGRSPVRDALGLISAAISLGGVVLLSEGARMRLHAVRRYLFRLGLRLGLRMGVQV